MAAQSSMAFSHGFALCGQQSVISSIMDMSAGSGDLMLTSQPVPSLWCLCETLVVPDIP
jgi:hypothetical protein